jgi:hypothetical protein
MAEDPASAEIIIILCGSDDLGERIELVFLGIHAYALKHVMEVIVIGQQGAKQSHCEYQYKDRSNSNNVYGPSLFG